LKTGLNPVYFCLLKEFGFCEGFEQVALPFCFRGLVVQRVLNPALKQLLIGNPDLDGIPLRTVLFEPVTD
jgi:hypothetical protein